MSTFTILPRVRQPGYKVEIVADNGARSTMLGFESEDEAVAWVTENRRLEAVHVISDGD